jgi:anti-anti-sigma factor
MPTGLIGRCQMVYFEIREADNVLAIYGELDGATVPLLQDALADASGSVSVVNLAGVSFVDSVGLLGLLSIVRSRDGVRLINPTRTTLRAMVVAGVERELMNA